MRFVQHARPTAVPDSLVEFLRNEAGMDSAEAVKSAQHLVRGKDIEIHFDLGENEAMEYLRGLGVEDSGVHALIRAVYHLLGLRTFFTTGEKETRAWTIHAGDKAATAAGVIHSDFERGFIAAETVQYDDLVALGSIARGREAGKLRSEGKDYLVRDGDVIFFRFNV